MLADVVDRGRARGTAGGGSSRRGARRRAVPGNLRDDDTSRRGAGRKRSPRARNSGVAGNGALIAPVLWKKMVEAPGVAPIQQRFGDLARSGAFTGQTADRSHVRRLHRVLRLPLDCPQIHQGFGAIVEAPGPPSGARRPAASRDLQRVIGNREAAAQTPVRTAASPVRSSSAELALCRWTDFPGGGHPHARSH